MSRIEGFRRALANNETADKEDRDEAMDALAFFFGSVDFPPPAIVPDPSVSQ